MNRTVSVLLPVLIEHTWQIPMTKCAIDTLRVTTQLPYELVIVETGSNFFKDDADFYIHISNKHNATSDLNRGLEKCSGNYIVYTGNDVFVRDGWLEALFACFDFDDCGAATLASKDLSTTPLAKFFYKHIILEGLYGPFMMFEAGWRYDEGTFPAAFADSDLITRIYQTKKRMYRNYAVVIEHLNKQTLTASDDEQEEFKKARKRYAMKHIGCPYLIYRFICEGLIV